MCMCVCVRVSERERERERESGLVQIINKTFGNAAAPISQVNNTGGREKYGKCET